jgi:hypothetical protein
VTPDDTGRKARQRRQHAIVGFALFFLVAHLPYLPASLEDLDSVNFALGIRHFDVAQHQPHPPGYPIYIVLAKSVRAIAPSESTALALISIVAGALGVIAIGALVRRLDGDRGPRRWNIAAVGVAMTAPLYWFSAARPLSDMTGLAAAVGVQALTLAATSARALAAAAFCAGLATGIRSQVAWLTVPLLVLRSWALVLGPSRVLGPASLVRHPRSLVLSVLAFLAGVVVWFVPLVVVTGGAAAYWHALVDQGAEDFGNIQMLWTTHNARALADALYYAFVAPWARWPLAAVVLGSAAVGLVWTFRRAQPALVALAAAFGPYLVLDLLFQETFTGRYALPLVVPIAYFAVAGLRALPYDTGLAAAAGIAVFSAHVGGTSIAAYAGAKAPAFRLLDDMAAAAPPAPVLAMDRRNAFDFRRPIAWAADAVPTFTRTLPAPPQHEWLEAVRYWDGGGRAPVWFVVDPMRTSIDLVQHVDPRRYRWPLPVPTLVSGARPNEMDWYQVERPEWYVGEGWALTPEAAGVADADRRGLAFGPIDARVSAATAGGTLLVGGRSFDTTGRPRLTVVVDGHSIVDDVLTPGPYLRLAPLPGDLGARDYATVTVATIPPARVAVEQFDASATRLLLGFGDGWHEQEFNPRTGLRWRWLSERGDLRVGAGGAPFILHLEGESPLKYFPRGSRLVVRSGTQVFFDQHIADDFAVDIPIAGQIGTLVLETDQVFSPADRSRRTADRRHLGLRVFKAGVRAAS